MPVTTEQAKLLKVDKLTFGTLFQEGGWWIGVHYSPNELRYCLNILPCLTIYWVMPGGYLPIRELKKIKEKLGMPCDECDAVSASKDMTHMPAFELAGHSFDEGEKLAQVKLALRDYAAKYGEKGVAEIIEQYVHNTTPMWIEAIDPGYYGSILNACNYPPRGASPPPAYVDTSSFPKVRSTDWDPAIEMHKWDKEPVKSIAEVRILHAAGASYMKIGDGPWLLWAPNG